MNIYGDHGNVLTLERRMQWRGITPTIIDYHPGDPFPSHPNLIIGGGGQDSGQAVIQQDLPRIAETLKQLINTGTPALVICGTYQLFGNYFQTAAGERIEGLHIFDLHTIAGDTRLIGNIVTHSDTFGEIVGYENHSGKTYLAPGLAPLAHVISGAGNNDVDKTEGIHYQNALGTYLHGPLLPKNPQIADHLIQTALTHKYGISPTPLPPLDDTLATQARTRAKARPR
jgi:CobQ-like glutamine amidotransferase family enzyme